jgi:hypothetical protein
MDFVIHVCKNPECNNCWIDEDRYNAQNKPPQWKYCPECEKRGFKNPKRKKCGMTPEQIEAFKQRMAEYRRNKKDEKIQP